MSYLCPELRTGPVSNVYVNEAVRMPVRRIREDRILHEANATSGDVRGLCDLFGLSIEGAERYTSITGRLLRVTRYEHVASLS